MKNGQTLTAICLSLKTLVEGGQSMSVCIGQSLLISYCYAPIKCLSLFDALSMISVCPF